MKVLVTGASGFIGRPLVSLLTVTALFWFSFRRVVPLIGPVQLHHAHYKCIIYYTQVTRVGWPIPHTLTDEDAQEVIYIDHNHFHMVGNVDTGAGANF